MNFRKSDYHYDLPKELIATQPAEPRDTSRMLVLDRSQETLQHVHFLDLPRFLEERVHLVVNDARVIPARILGRRQSGARLELLLVRKLEAGVWHCKVKNAAKVKEGEEILLCQDLLPARLLSKGEEGLCRVDFGKREDFFDLLQAYAFAPLPPYINQAREVQGDREQDLKQYQTLFAAEPGAVAAPTAGLHFTPRVLNALSQKGVGLSRVTLHVGLGTFEPMRVDDIREHQMHAEIYQVSPQAAEEINQAKAQGKKILAVGTTAARTLEAASQGGKLIPGQAETQIFIYPPYRFQMVDLLLTNFHLPESTLLMMLAALVGREKLLDCYRQAIEQGYRFYSYGDCMLVL